MRALCWGVLLVAAPAAAKTLGEGRWFLRMERPGMIPAVVTGVLQLGEGRGTWSFTELDGWAEVPLEGVRLEGRKVSFAVAHPKWRLAVEGEIGRDGLEGKCSWPPRTYDFRALREVPRFDGKPPRDAATVAPGTLDPIIRSAEAMDTDALLVLKDGKVGCDRTFTGKPRPFYLMSVTKSVAALAVPFLVEEKKVASLDAPLSTWFPEWKDGLKAKVTLRHVLTHTSGLEHLPSAATLNAEKDGVGFARASPVTVEPGTVFSYNNRAVALLAGIVEEASGEPIDRYLETRLFRPLGIRAQWHKDPAGNVRTYADLRMGARDLAKIGQLMLDGGKPLPEGWAAKLTEPSALEKSCGLLWWILYDERGERIGFHANGDLGQILAVYPKGRVVGVRLRDPPGSADPTEERFHSFGRFYGFLSRLTP